MMGFTRQTNANILLEGPVDTKESKAVKYVATKNDMGFMFLQIDQYVEDWLNEWNRGDKPLLDLGCAYGIHTLHAMGKGCDVISVDMEELHILELQEKSTLPEYTAGNLISTHVQRLPVPKGASLLEEGSVSAVLISEVFHFLQIGEPLQIMKQVHNWLIPGGRVFVSSASSKGIPEALTLGAKVNGGQTESEYLAFVDKCTDEELIESGASFTLTNGVMPWKTLYLMTTKELESLARLAGFEVEKSGYHSPKKYPIGNTEEECTMLVARKPNTHSLNMSAEPFQK